MSLAAIKMETVMTSAPITVSEDTDLATARRLLKAKKIRHLPVTQDKRLTGVLSDRDVKLVALLPDIGKMAVADLMTRHPSTASGNTPVLDVVAKMAATKRGCTIVTDARGEVQGIFTTEDALRLLLEEKGITLPPQTAFPIGEYDSDYDEGDI